MNHRPRPRRHRVVLRPKVRSQRVRLLAAAGALACLGAMALVVLLQFKRQGADWSALKARLVPAPRGIEVDGAPPELKDKLTAFLEPRLAAPASAAELLAAFPCLKSAGLSRSYWTGTFRYVVEPRKAVGAAARAGRYLADDGTVFAAPEGVYAVSGPALEFEGATGAELKELAGFLSQSAKPGSLPAALEKMRFVSAAEGWEARLADGTVLIWGDLRFTRQKLSRLREILDDARAQFGGASSADLRYFEDGRVLVRPPLRAGR
ncbi:MAG: hypothetical protein HY077_03090 [Elusimicrobia bacterium]|nr:hypothetical protein [Elusimicrobiota bacterium]